MDSPSAQLVDTENVQSRFMIDTGYRRDRLDWSIAGKLFDYTRQEDVIVNVLSELTWRDLDIFLWRFSNETIFADHYLIRFSYQTGTIYDGDNQDSDYKGPDRTEEWSRSNNSADDGDVSDFSIAAGYRFKLWKNRIALTPLLGYSYHEQNLVMTDGNQTVSEPDPALRLNPPDVGPFDGLNSTYETRWRGPWLGLDADYTVVLNRPVMTMMFGLGIEYHWAYYSASADWNLRSDLAHPESFEHETAGTGIVMAAKWRCQFANQWGVNLTVGYQDWTTDAGTDRVYLSNGEVDETRLNSVNWTSESVLFGIDYTF
ncbi:MAG: hypothetical protein QNJ22_04540 [Desulfosarcinaceae bacterium]|nr:hypothetical protein [Desulfosarcinaceae bacterium]